MDGGHEGTRLHACDVMLCVEAVVLVGKTIPCCGAKVGHSVLFFVGAFVHVSARANPRYLQLMSRVFCFFPSLHAFSSVALNAAPNLPGSFRTAVRAGAGVGPWTRGEGRANRRIPIRRVGNGYSFLPAAVTHIGERDSTADTGKHGQTRVLHVCCACVARVLHVCCTCVTSSSRLEEHSVVVVELNIYTSPA